MPTVEPSKAGIMKLPDDPNSLVRVSDAREHLYSEIVILEMTDPGKSSREHTFVNTTHDPLR